MSVSVILRKALRSLVWTTTKTNPKKVFFSSFTGNTYSDNPKAISEKLHEMDPGIEIVWLSSGNSLEGLPTYAKQVSRRNLVSYLKAIASSKVIVDNFGYYYPKKKDQIYIQTWHGDRAFKRILYDSPFYSGRLVPESKPGFCDLAVAGSDYGERQYRSAFRYTGEVLKVGTPRDDILVHGDEALTRSMRERIGLAGEYRYLLYAPTLRRENQNSNTRQNIQQIDIPSVLETLGRQYGGTWKCLLRAHPAVAGLTGAGTDGETVIDVSAYPDMTDLMIAADVLITDYSSCAGDFALLHRPIFLFQDDIDEYLKKDRTLYFEMSDSPYLAAHSQEELDRLILLTTAEDAAANCDAILDFYGTNETGKAAEAVANRIIQYCSRS